uniref:Uncharacterized protein n=1 Tax=Clastoptera arizonana TaxID=38151 RepID=A0A1B6CDN3_9HEMI
MDSEESRISDLDQGEPLSHPEIMDIVNRLKDMDSEERESLLSAHGEEETAQSGSKQFLILMSMVIVLVCVFAFICYHLYNSLMAREERRKKKQKKEIKTKLLQKKRR